MSRNCGRSIFTQRVNKKELRVAPAPVDRMSPERIRSNSKKALATVLFAAFQIALIAALCPLNAAAQVRVAMSLQHPGSKSNADPGFCFERSCVLPRAPFTWPPISPVKSASIYYIDNSLPDIHPASATPDCSTYNPATFSCGGGSSAAFASVADINAIQFKEDDQILFRRGEVWREQLTDAAGTGGYSGASGQPIVFGSFGDPQSELPIISGANLFTDWNPAQFSVAGIGVMVYSAPYFIAVGSGIYSPVPYSEVPNQVFEDGVRLSQNSSSYESLAPGQWYLDTANNKIWVRLSNDENPVAHTIEASQREFAIEIFNQSYITISNIQTEDANNTGINFGPFLDPENATYQASVVSGVSSLNNFYDGIALNSSEFDVVGSSIFASNGRNGINFTQTPFLLIDQNVVHDNDHLYIQAKDGPTVGGIKGDAFSRNTIVQNNLVYSNGMAGNAMVAGGISFDTTGEGSIIRYNRIFNNSKDGIELDANSQNTVYGNVVYGNNWWGIRAFADAQGTMTGMQIYGNTLSGNGRGGIYLAGPAVGSSLSGCTDNAVINNIAVNSVSGPNLLAMSGCENPGLDGSGNVYMYNSFGTGSPDFIAWGVDPATKKNVYESSYMAWETANANCRTTGCSHSVEADPLFVMESTSDFALSYASPAIGAGLNLGVGFEGILNPASSWPLSVIIDNQNNQGSKWDIGAYQVE